MMYPLSEQKYHTKVFQLLQSSVNRLGVEFLLKVFSASGESKLTRTRNMICKQVVQFQREEQRGSRKWIIGEREVEEEIRQGNKK